MWNEQTSPTFLVLVAASIVAHVALLAILPPADAASDKPRSPTFVTIEAATPPPPPAPPPVATPPAPETVSARAPAPRAPRPVSKRHAAPSPQVATAEPPAEQAEAPADFSGVTLSNDGASWSSPTGNGEAMTGPIVAADPGTARGPVHRGPPATQMDRVVAVGNLSRPPKAPDLDDALAANYPSDARRAGLTGKALVRARILADGTVGPIRVMSESTAGFGAACKRTLTGSHWQPPLDANREPVITDINYTCTFAVAR